MPESWKSWVLADPWFLLLLLPALVWVFWRRRPAALGAPALRAFRRLPQTLRMRLLPWQKVLLGLSLLFFCLALARPQKLERRPLETRGVDLMLCLDLSSSMQARDLEGPRGRSRIEVVKDVAAKFIQRRENDRIGLAGFALFPELLSPPTVDHQSLIRILEHVQTKGDRDPDNKTGIGGGLAFCVDFLKESKARSKVVVLLSDGLENVNYITPKEAADLAHDAGIRVYTIGAGAVGGQGLFGAVELDFKALKLIARETQGRFFRATDKKGLETIFDTIDKLETSELKEEFFLRHERFDIPLGLAMLAFLLAFLLRFGALGVTP
ncbi:MAG TPA: VWA domain-containing protein [Planctomycetes bacterium]|nr:VWA domain-containing protein [Planctomycetota bacterium]